ncbi:MAG: hypothetical protein Q9222_002106 [Ikaeria aurantiellina]
MIYAQVLIAKTTSNKIKNSPEPHISRRAAVHLTPLRNQPGKFKVTSHGDFAPQILSTCRTINREATPILYADNYFIFHSDGLCLPPSNTLRLPTEKACKDLMLYPLRDWPAHSPKPLQQSTIASFFRQIGPLNAADITQIELYTSCTLQLLEDLKLATALLAHHTPALESFAITVLHGKTSDPFLGPAHFAATYRTLTDCIFRLHWIKDFYYDCPGGYHRFDHTMDPETKIRVLEEFVRVRPAEDERSREWRHDVGAWRAAYEERSKEYEAQLEGPKSLGGGPVMFRSYGHEFPVLKSKAKAREELCQRIRDGMEKRKREIKEGKA